MDSEQSQNSRKTLKNHNKKLRESQKSSNWPQGSYSPSSSNDQKPKVGRPPQSKQQQKYTVEHGLQQMHFPVIKFMSKFGISDGLACEEDDEQGSRVQTIQKIYEKYQGQMEAVLKKYQTYQVKINHQDIVLYLEMFAKSVDQVFYQDYCELLIHVFLSLSFEAEVDIQNIIYQFFRNSKVFHLKQFREAYRKKHEKIRQTKTKKIKSQSMSKFNKKIIDKVNRNFQNSRKQSKSRNKEFDPDLKYLLDEEIIKKQFGVLFKQLSEMALKFMMKPQPFLSLCRVMQKCLLQIMNGMYEEV